jgi:hypothetical protein
MSSLMIIIKVSLIRLLTPMAAVVRQRGKGSRPRACPICEGCLRPPVWSSGQSFWLQIQRSGFYSRRYQTFWEIVGLERSPLSLLNTAEELLGRSSGSGLGSREYGRRDPLRWPRGSLYPQKLAVTSPTSSGRSVGIVCSWTHATKFSFISTEGCLREDKTYKELIRE